MTKRERQLKSMLNYYEIDMESTRDEKMTKSERNEFLKNLNSAYEAHVIQEVVKQLKDKLKGNQSDSEEPIDPFFESIQDDSDGESNALPPDNFNIEDIMSGGPVGNAFGLNPEIEKFIIWISDMLYSADHIVVIRSSEDGMTTNIELRKLKKRGGKKK